MTQAAQTAERPRLRRDIRFFVREGSDGVIVEDAGGHAYHAIGPVEHRIFQLLDGTRTLADVAAQASAEFDVELGADDVGELVRAAGDLGLLDLSSGTALSPAAARHAARLARRALARESGGWKRGPGPRADPALLRDALAAADAGQLQTAAALLERASDEAPGDVRPVRILEELQAAVHKARKKTGTVLLYPVKLFDPTPILARLDRTFGFLIHPALLLVAFASFLFAGTTLLLDEGLLDRALRLAQTPSSWWIVVPLYALSTLLTIGHELTHGLVCHHFGGRVKEVGVAWMGVTPNWYCDVSSSYVLSSKWQRAAVPAAGPVYECFVSGLLVLLYSATTPGTALHHVLMVAATLRTLGAALTVLPYLKDDFYHTLVEVTDCPNLLDKSLDAVRSLLCRGLLGLPVEAPELEPHERRVVWSYGLLNLAFTAFILSKTIAVGFTLAVSYLQGLGALLVMALLVFVLGRRLLRLLRFLWAARALLVRSPTFWKSAVVAQVVVVFVALFPVSESEVMECRYDVRDVHVASSIDGDLVSVAVKVGDVVKAGDPLVVLENAQVSLDTATCLAELDAASAEARLVSEGANDIELAPLRASVSLERQKLAAARRGYESAARASDVGEANAAAGVAAQAAQLQDAEVGLSDVAARLRDKERGTREEEREIADARVAVVAARCQHLADLAAALVVQAPRGGTVLEVLDAVARPRGERLPRGTDVARIAVDDVAAARAVRSKAAPAGADVELDLPAYQAERWGVVGETLEVRLGAAPTRTWRAVVVTVAPQASGSSVRVVARLRDDDAPLLLDGSCFARFTSEQTPLYDRLAKRFTPLFVQSFWRAF